MPPKFIFLRHGEATHNVAYHVEGEAVFTNPEFKDAPLTEKGIEQAKEAAIKLSSLMILDIWSSPLTRCLQTLEEIFEECDIGSVYLHDNLVERLGGAYHCNERKTRSEIKKFVPWDCRYLPDLPSFWAKREDTDVLYQRMYMFMMFLAKLYKDVPETSHILIVGHNDAIQTLTGKSLRNAEYMILTLEEAISR